MANKNKNSGKLTLANKIAIIAMAALALITFFGYMYGSEDGEMGLSLIFTAIIILLLSGSLAFAIKAKGAESDFGNWRIMKYLALSIYIITAFVGLPPVLRYFYVTSEKESLKTMARDEIAAIDSLYSSYNHLMAAKTKDAVQQLKNYYSSGTHSRTMDEYITSMSIDQNELDTLGGKITKVWRIAKDSELKMMSDQIDNWGMFDLYIAQIGATISEKAENVYTTLNQKVEDNITKHKVIPVFVYNGRDYIHDGYFKHTFECPDTGKFHKALTQNNYSSVLGWLMFFLIHSLALFNYLVAQSSNVVGPRPKKGQNNLDNSIKL